MCKYFSVSKVTFNGNESHFYLPLFFQLSKKYGPVFTVYFGLKKVVVLAGYRTVKQALVNHAEEFGDREVTPLFYDFNKGHGKNFFLIFFFL